MGPLNTKFVRHSLCILAVFDIRTIPDHVISDSISRLTANERTAQESP